MELPLRLYNKLQAKKHHTPTPWKHLHYKITNKPHTQTTAKQQSDQIYPKHPQLDPHNCHRTQTPITHTHLSTKWTPHPANSLRTSANGDFPTLNKFMKLVWLETMLIYYLILIFTHTLTRDTTRPPNTLSTKRTPPHANGLGTTANGDFLYTYHIWGYCMVGDFAKKHLSLTLKPT